MADPTISASRTDLATSLSGFEPLPSILTRFSGETAPPRVLFLGDSVVLRVADQDADRRSLAEMTTDALCGIDTLAVGHSGFRAPHYRDYLQLLGVLRAKPDLLVLPLNLRTLSPQWNRNPAHAHPAHRHMVGAVTRNILGLPRQPPDPVVPSDDAAMHAFRAIPLRNPLGRHGTVGSIEALKADQGLKAVKDAGRLREIFVYHYALPIQPECRELDKWRGIAAFAAKCRIKLLIYTTPVNIGAGTHFAGPAFAVTARDKIRAFKDHVIGESDPGELRFLDLHDTVPRGQFFHGELASEHLAQDGRAAVAERIGTAVRRWLAIGSTSANRRQ